MKPTIFKQIASTVIYTVVLFFVLWGVNLFINWGLRNFIGPVFDWFLGQNLVIKIILFIVLGSTVTGLIFSIFKAAGKIVSVLLSFIFIYNSATVWISIIMCSLNALFSLIDMWKFIYWNFWVIVIWAILAFFIVEMNWLFIFRDRKDLDQQAGIDSYQ